jgi:hypothetical protein
MPDTTEFHLGDPAGIASGITDATLPRLGSTPAKEDQRGHQKQLDVNDLMRSLYT